MAQRQLFTLLIVLASTITKAVSLPLHDNLLPQFQPRSTLSKRAPKPRDIGIGFAITISVIVFGLIVFYLGVRRGQTGTWYCWRDISANNASTPTLINSNPSSNLTSQDKLKARISCPIPLSSSAPVELSPVEAPRPTPAFLELPANDAKVIYEMGQPSPRRPSWFERRSWWRGDDSRKSRLGPAPPMPTEKQRSLYEVSGESAKPPAYEDGGITRPESAWVRSEERGSRGSAGGGGVMDWSGLEYVRKMYAARRSMHKSAL